VSRHLTPKRIAATLVFIVTSLGSVCSFRVIEGPGDKSAAPRTFVNPVVPVITEREEPQQLVDIFTDEDVIFYKGYELRRCVQAIGRERAPTIEVSCALLIKNGQTLFQFDGVYFSEGNSTEFGLFNLLGNDSQQFIISQTAPRTGRHWVVDVSSGARVIFDSSDYSAGREEFYIIDLDKDGVYEISLPVTAFYGMQDKMYIGEIPLPELIFKYDAKVRNYVRANHLFPDYTLHGIERDIEQLGDDDGNYLSKRLDILLRYTFAGKWDEGWAFFNREYQRSDKDEIKTRIVGILKQDL
jgi:hypothetical protein